MRPVLSTFDQPPAIESLESRRLLSAAPSAVFIGATPAVVLPNQTAQAMIRVIASNAGSPTRVELFASPTRDMTAGATRLASSNPIGAGRRNVRLRFSSSSVGVGNFYIVAKLVPASNDAAGALAVAAAPRRTRFAAATVDLSAAFISEPRGQVYVNSSQDTRSSAVLRISNSGTVPAAGKISAAIYASATTSFDGSAVVIGSVTLPRARIAAGASRLVTVPITFKAGTAFGGYTLFAKVDGLLSIAETRTANNLIKSSSAIVISQALPTHVHHHHHHDDGGGVDVIGIIGDDDSGDYTDISPDDPGDDNVSDSDGGGGGGGGDYNYTPPVDSGSTTQPGAPTTSPTTQPDDGDSSDDWVDDVFDLF